MVPASPTSPPCVKIPVTNVKIVFAFQAIICFTFAAASVSWQSANAEDHTYLDEDKPAGETYIIQLLTFYVAYSHLIPISLYVALEVVKMALAYLIG